MRMTVLDKDIVAEYYIECELDNIVDGDAIQLKKDLYHSSTARLLEALSFTYRANFVFDYVYGGEFRWEKRTVRADDITLTGMGEHLTEIIYSEHVQRNPRMFVEYIAALSAIFFHRLEKRVKFHIDIGAKNYVIIAEKA